VIGYAPVLDQVAKNLLNNALKHVSPGDRPTITIGAFFSKSQTLDADMTALSTTESNLIDLPQVYCFFQDTGIGISAKDQSKFFQPFSRLHGVESYPGSGFGLAIVQRGITRLGGTCGVESSLQQGSRFWIKLPAYLPQSSDSC